MSTSTQRNPFAFGVPARRTVRVSEESLVRTGSLEEGGPVFPLLVEPNVEGLDAVTWARQHRDWIEERLAEHGALLFRGFGIDSAERFQELLAAASGEPLEYTERSSPRNTVAGRIYTSTEHPPDQAFAWRQGDVLLLDNLLVAHGREPFSGERRILTGMADLVEWERVGAGVDELDNHNREEHIP
jgi:alpha-ketoglutarate-dependent taurine dioxygenase